MTTRPRDTMLYDSVLDAIRPTPIVALRRVAPDLEASERTVCIKLELVNPGGSHKVRIAKAMVDAAERDGILRPGSGQTILEPTGGNTGVGLAMIAAVRGYRLVLVVPDNYSPAKQALLRAFGARIELSDSRRGGNSHGERAVELLLEHPDWVLLDQQSNPANPDVHYRTTGPEVVAALGTRQRLDAFVAGVGTGGHLTGIGRALREAWPAVRIIAVEPEGCSLPDDRFVPHDLQGLAVGLVPAVLDLRLVDEWVAVTYSSAVEMVRALMRTEGLAVGLSSAANVVAALQVARGLPPGSTVLTMAYDSVHDYLGALPAQPAREGGDACAHAS